MAKAKLTAKQKVLEIYPTAYRSGFGHVFIAGQKIGRGFNDCLAREDFVDHNKSWSLAWKEVQRRMLAKLEK